MAKPLRFGPNELNEDRYELRRAGRRLHLSKTPLDLLILLVRERGTLVTRQQIAAHLWPGEERADTESAINNAVNRVRAVLNDPAGRPRYIETVVGRGYRFVGAVEEVTVAEQTVVAGLADHEERSAPRQPGTADPTTVRGKNWGRLSLFVVCLAVLAVGAGTWWTRRGTSQTPAKWEPVRITTNESGNGVTAGAISPDGKLLAYADPNELWLRVLKTGITDPLYLPPGLRVNRIAWFADNLQLVLSGFNTPAASLQVWREPITGKGASLVRRNAADAAPSPDGSELAYTAQGDSEIWLMGVDGENPRLFVKGAKGETFPFLFWAGGGKRLSYQRRQFVPGNAADRSRDLDANYRYSYGSRELATGQEVARVGNIRFDSAAVASGGRMIYLRAKSPGNATLGGIWEVRTNPATGAFLSPPRELASTGEDIVSGLSISADGKQAAATIDRGQADTYVADLQEPGPKLVNVRRLTSDLMSDYPHAWTRDSQSIIFESDREGNFHLYRQRLNGRTAEKLTEMAGEQVVPQTTPDGHWVLYAWMRRRVPSFADALYRSALDGGHPDPVAAAVPLAGPLDEFRCPLLTGSCVLRETVDRREYVFYALDPIQGKGRELARTAWIPSVFGDWALSPDGKTVAIPYHDPGKPRIRLVPLDAAATGRRETEIAVRAEGTLWGLNWAEDSAGWLAELRKSGDIFLVYLDAGGNARVLRQSAYNTWAVPSPDGKKLAFAGYTADRNIWIWK
ncbi:MAG: winged helix-turn-helix domain-containing protein [Bryobacteraceae bacterium]